MPLIAVFDDLCRNERFHKELKNPKYIGSFESEPLYKFVKVPGFDISLLENGTRSIYFEVYDVTYDVLSNLDVIYWYNFYETSPDKNIHERKTITTPYGKADVYFLNEECFPNLETNNKPYKK